METPTINTTDLSLLSTDDLQALLNSRMALENAEKAVKRTSYEALKEATVISLCADAQRLEESIKYFRETAFNDMDALYELLCEYSNRHSEGKGNFTLESIDGDLKIAYSRQNLGFFDERSTQAESHISDFINSEFAEGDKIKKLVLTLLERKKGKLDIKMVQKLYSMETDYENQNWVDGIRLLKESYTPSGSRPYINFYRKVNGAWELINLNFASTKTA